MAKPFKSEIELKNFLLQKCKTAVKNTADGAYQEIKDNTVAWYGDYTPIDGGYQRTDQLNAAKNENFIIREVNYSGDSCEETIKLDTSGIYNSGKNPSREQVVDTAAQGLHGVKDGDGWKYVGGKTGVKLWDEGLQAKVQDELIQALIAQGIPIKKG